ncbi:hypothetical protein [Bifidobacterium scaligerum]|uniref:SynChlorMet cassette protein ScmC n=1 Tax=Bifidobacterium scaligerum TaxID=2052656 RepID=A0A2M9HPF9_9BIFI|nr:hypothetical protein [Bifidobacterium scaligerum]PJM78659.1 hypothetical protein CUU80_07920 [Bifidobacterium scaligerum]
MADYLLRMADLTIAVHSIHDRLAQQGKAYLLPSNGFDRDSAISDLSVYITQADIERERSLSETGNWDDSYLETLAILRKIAETIPTFRRLVFHGATISYANHAYIFTAPSGTGKTTHIRLWKRLFGDEVSVINGDKPILKIDSPRIVAYGTPWAGKERWETNMQAPVAGICIVTRACEKDTYHDDMKHSIDSTRFTDEHGIANSCTRIKPDEALPLILRQTYMPTDPKSAIATLDLLDSLLRDIPIYRLRCTISKAAVRASSSAMVHGAHQFISSINFH